MIKEGDRFPTGMFYRVTESGLEKMPTAELFDKRTVVLFHVVGAFTPTCSVEHLPGFLKLEDKILAKGVDVIACYSTNDAMVMDAWEKQVSSGKKHKLMVLSDGNGDVTRALGLQIDARGFGMGARGQRFAMIVKDGVVDKLLVETDPTVAQVSSARSILKALS